ncbi:hypothetical protein WN943_013147 [Citrus x changshan-huyou]
MLKTKQKKKKKKKKKKRSSEFFYCSQATNKLKWVNARPVLRLALKLEAFVGLQACVLFDVHFISGSLNLGSSSHKIRFQVRLKMDYVLRILSGFNCVMGLSLLE